MKFKTQIAAIAYHLLRGKKISTMNAFNYFGCTNAPREIGRSIERKFGVTVERIPQRFVSRYGQTGIFFVYKLIRKDENIKGINKMIEYVVKNSIEDRECELFNIM